MFEINHYIVLCSLKLCSLETKKHNSKPSFWKTSPTCRTPTDAQTHRWLPPCTTSPESGPRRPGPGRGSGSAGGVLRHCNSLGAWRRATWTLCFQPDKGKDGAKVEEVQTGIKEKRKKQATVFAMSWTCKYRLPAGRRSQQGRWGETPQRWPLCWLLDRWQGRKEECSGHTTLENETCPQNRTCGALAG